MPPGRIWHSDGANAFSGKRPGAPYRVPRHGGEAREERDNFARLSDPERSDLLDFLNTPGAVPAAPNFNPADPE